MCHKHSSLLSSGNVLIHDSTLGKFLTSPYNPDLVPSDFNLLSKVKKKHFLGGNHFETNDALKAFINNLTAAECNEGIVT